MPSLGADMVAGTLVEWLVTVGQPVTRGQIIAEVETEKGVVEVEVFETGAIEELLVVPGTKVPVGTPLARIKTEGGPAGALAAPSEAKPAPAAPPVAAAAPEPAAPAGRQRVSPLARKRAEDLGIGLDRVVGTGPAGAVTVADVERSAAPGVRSQAMRRAIGAAMSRSKREIPHYYLATDIDVTPLSDWLAARNASRPVTDRMLVAAPLLKGVALALSKHPSLNGTFVDGQFRQGPAVHLGVAISLRGGGLMAPALHDAATKPVDTLMTELTDLINRVRAGSVRSSELADPTVTVTSLGETGVPTVFGIIFPPQVALIGLGRIVARPWVVDGALISRQILTATLSADHRVTDGHEGARFLTTLDRLLQEPERL